MRSFVILACAVLVTCGVQMGCQSDRVPPPAPARVPGPDERRMSADWESARRSPGTPVSNDLPPPPFDDVPLVSEESPETPAFVDAYNQVGRPRIVVWVAHAPGDSYDEAASREIDYVAIENILGDWFSAGGRVAIIAPEAARQALSVNQAQDLNSGHPAGTQEIGDRLRADVLVFVRAQPTHQGGGGTAVRLVADASNIRGGESLGHAVVDVPPPLDKPRISKFTRYVARKLMADMTGRWTSFGPPPATQPSAAGAQPVNPLLR